MRYPHRCSRCRKRTVLRNRIHNYVRPPKCSCGFHLVFDKAEWKRRLLATPCQCDGAHYPHRKGGVLLCEHHPTGPSEEDFQRMHC